MNEIDEAAKRVDLAIDRLEKAAQQERGAPARARLATELDEVLRRVDVALARARALHAALD